MDTVSSAKTTRGDRSVGVDVQIWDGAAPAIVMLHDGLGSISQWRDLPRTLSETTGSMVMAYNRPGHGSAKPVPSGPWPVTWMHDEADRLCHLLEAARIDRPLMVGHSDGASIALLAVSRGLDVSGILALAPHSFVEPVCAGSIDQMRSNREPIVEGLRRHHQNPEALFEAWSGVWVSPEFSTWDIRSELATIDVPCVVVQGDADEYATDLQLDETVAAVNAGGSEASALARRWTGLGHLLHHDAPDRIITEVTELLAQLD